MKSKGVTRRSRSKFEVGKKGKFISEADEENREVAMLYNDMVTIVVDRAGVLEQQYFSFFIRVPQPEELQGVVVYETETKESYSSDDSNHHVSSEVSGETTPNVIDDTMPIETVPELIPYDPMDCIEAIGFKIFGEEEIKLLMATRRK